MTSRIGWVKEISFHFKKNSIYGKPMRQLFKSSGLDTNKTPRDLPPREHLVLSAIQSSNPYFERAHIESGGV